MVFLPLSGHGQAASAARWTLPHRPRPPFWPQGSCRRGGLHSPRPSSQRAATSPAPSILATTLGNVASSSPGGLPSRPRVAAPSRAVCSASVASPSDFGIAPHTAGALQMRTLNSGLGRPWRRHGLLPRKLSLKGTGGIPLQGGVARSASAGVGRLSVGQVTLHLASTVFGWGALATSPLDLGIATPLGPSNARPQFLPLATLAT
jgi:hypothetical protein